MDILQRQSVLNTDKCLKNNVHRSIPLEREGAEQTENGGMNQQNVQRDKNPLDMGDVTVVLWSIE